jgi:uncharacterized protein
VNRVPPPSAFAAPALAADASRQPCRMQLGSLAIELLAEGAAWLPDERTLLVADLHLEKASSLARRGRFLPPYDTAATLLALASLVVRFDPGHVICLGDSFHDREAEGRLAERSVETLRAMQRGRRWTWIAGNHDPQSGSSLQSAGVGGDCLNVMLLRDVELRHEPDFSSPMAHMAGHLHPCARLLQRGRVIRARAFAKGNARPVTTGVAGPSVIVLPAFGAMTGSLNVLDPAFCGLMRSAEAAVAMIGRNGVYRVPPGKLILD